MHKTREQRQDEALMRQLARTNRTIREQLALICRRPGRSFRETIRLLAQERMEA